MNEQTEQVWQLPFLISFSFLNTLLVSAVMKASPFSHRLSTETPGLAVSMRARIATGIEKTHKQTTVKEGYGFVMR